MGYTVNTMDMKTAMQRVAFALILCLGLLLGCQETDSDAAVALLPSPTAEAPSTPLPTAAPSPTATATPSPTPTATPSPTPAGLIGGKYDVFSYEGVMEGDLSYVSDKLSIRLSTHTDNPYSRSRLVYYVADIYLQDITSFRTAAAKDFLTDSRRPMKTVAAGVNAILAANGDFSCGKKSLLMIRNGNLEQLAFSRNRETCLLYRDGTMAVFTPDTLSEADLDMDRIWQAWQFGPYLINEDGTPRTAYTTNANFGQNPRTVLGYYEPGHYCLVVVDGRKSSHSLGLTLPELSQLMVDLGCTQAFNLDGGATSQLYWQGDIFNVPSGNRNQLDILYFVEPEGE